MTCLDKEAAAATDKHCPSTAEGSSQIVVQQHSCSAYGHRERQVAVADKISRDAAEGEHEMRIKQNVGAEAASAIPAASAGLLCRCSPAACVVDEHTVSDERRCLVLQIKRPCMCSMHQCAACQAALLRLLCRRRCRCPVMVRRRRRSPQRVIELLTLLLCCCIMRHVPRRMGGATAETLAHLPVLQHLR